MADSPQPSAAKCGKPHTSTLPSLQLTVDTDIADADIEICDDDDGAGSHGRPQQLLQITSQPHDQRSKRRNSQTLSAAFDLSSCEVLSTSSVSTATSNRKRKTSPYTCSSFEDDCHDAKSTRSSIPDKKQNHSEIEKRRRDKMNNYILELSSMIPICNAMSRKLDKLTVLRMAVQHMRSVRGAISAGPLTLRPRPAFLSEQDLNNMVLKAAEDSFLMVVGCDRGRLLYVSCSVTKMLQYDQAELLGQSLFDILHPKDVAKVKEQLSASDLNPRERFIDTKTMLPVKTDYVSSASRLCPGARRSFFCRIKCRAATVITAPSCTVTSGSLQPPHVKEEQGSDCNPTKRKKQTERKYCVVQFTGYLKSWAPTDGQDNGNADGMADDGDASNLSCLVAVGRSLTELTRFMAPAPHRRLLQFTSRHATDSKFVFVDQRVTLVLGFLPQELLGTSLYEHVNASELSAVAKTHKAALLQRDALKTPPYNFKKKDGSYIRIQTHFKPFNNPWTRDVDCLVANNTVVADDAADVTPEDSSFDVFHGKADAEMQRLIDSQVESHKIGSTIADEVLRRSPTEFSAELPADLLQDAVFIQQPTLDTLLGAEVDSFEGQVRNNVPLSAAGAADTPPPEVHELPANSPQPASPPLPTLSFDGNGEATMAVIMSLLEADAGLGGPVNFNGLPWPLP
ncbi:protein cycle isoform X2 [Bicyclus anynana]|uniref:Protein cycle isoform X2 n=1 Tax=Bicyclus anynana TaxID=110368 RepID=A0ABM3M5T5_BICAN|nr:protein cycle isoform X2 [Bicyclus anynana]